MLLASAEKEVTDVVTESDESLQENSDIRTQCFKPATCECPSPQQHRDARVCVGMTVAFDRKLR
eukprot:scaffold73131_cov15-Tisochrysis_lutea.AAC.1